MLKNAFKRNTLQSLLHTFDPTILALSAAELWSAIQRNPVSKAALFLETFNFEQYIHALCSIPLPDVNRFEEAAFVVKYIEDGMMCSILAHANLNYIAVEMQNFQRLSTDDADWLPEDLIHDVVKELVVPPWDYCFSHLPLTHAMSFLVLEDGFDLNEMATLILFLSKYGTNFSVSREVEDEAWCDLAYRNLSRSQVSAGMDDEGNSSEQENETYRLNQSPGYPPELERKIFRRIIATSNAAFHFGMCTFA